MKNLFLNDLVFLLINWFCFKKFLIEFYLDLFGILNDNCFKMSNILRMFFLKKGSGLIIKKLIRLKRLKSILLIFDFKIFLNKLDII